MKSTVTVGKTAAVFIAIIAVALAGIFFLFPGFADASASEQKKINSMHENFKASGSAQFEGIATTTQESILDILVKFNKKIISEIGLGSNSATETPAGTDTQIPAGTDFDLRLKNGTPSISAEQINLILQGTPLKGKGQFIENLSIKYNIDPAFALAFFKQESNFGAIGAGATNKNPGNLRLPNSSTGFQKFSSMEEGIEAWFRLIANGSYYYKAGKFTLEEIAPVYAPSSENNTEAYIAAVKKSVQEYRALGK